MLQFDGNQVRKALNRFRKAVVDHRWENLSSLQIDAVAYLTLWGWKEEVVHHGDSEGTEKFEHGWVG
jgi:hypothetical protein